jgi:hypothetical protein
MKGNRIAVTVVVVILVVLAGAWLLRRSGGGEAIDLIDQLGSASKAPASAAFAVDDVKLDTAMRAIELPGGAGSRITWSVRVPDNGWLRVNVGMRPESWNQPGDGVKFLVLVSDGKSSEELFSQHVDPFNNPADRKWIPVMVDLSGYGGEQVDLIFNTYASMPNTPVNVDNDLPLWGNPEILIR